MGTPQKYMLENCVLRPSQVAAMKPASMSDSRDLAEEHRRRQFLAAYRTPGRWMYVAMRHKRAADLLYERAYDAWCRNITRQPVGELHGQELEDFQDETLL